MDVERPSGVVCSSDPTADGGNARYRRTVGEARAGDLVVHYRKPHVVAFSRALEDGTHHDQLPFLQGDDYGAGWRFRSEYFDLEKPVLREAFGESLVPFRVSHYPIDKRGFVCQGYFFPFDLRGLVVVLTHMDGPLPAWLEVHRPGRPLLPEEVAGSTALWEGAVSRIIVNAYERNPEARRRWIEHYGARCVICGFDFGEVAEGLIHVHHLKPISGVGGGYVVDPIQDLRPVCPNCHAVIHLRTDPPYLIEDVKSFLGRATQRDDPGGRR